jgi:hypothetical protein
MKTTGIGVKPKVKLKEWGGVGEGGKFADKPGSVVGSHSSGPDVAVRL